MMVGLTGVGTWIRIESAPTPVNRKRAIYLPSSWTVQFATDWTDRETQPGQNGDNGILVSKKKAR